MPKLTKREVEAAEGRTTDYFMWCSETPGFGVRIMPSGRRTYLVQYRAAGRTRRVKIGLHGALTVEEARREARALLGEVAKGGNPAEERATRRAAITVRELVARYWAAAGKRLIPGKAGAPKKARTLSMDRRRIDRHILPLLGNRKVVDLMRADIARFMRDVSVGSGRATATRTVGLLGGILSFAVEEGIIASNPAHGIKRPPDQRRTARLVPDDYGRLGLALDAMLEQGGNAYAIAAVRLIALTGCRKGEVEQLRWDEVDGLGHALRLADSKEGASVRPLGQAALAVLANLGPRVPGAHVLPGRSGTGHYGGLPDAWERLAKAAALEGMTLHTLRHSFASVAADLGYSEPTIAAMLGHASGSVTGRYVHHLDSVLVAAADRVSDAIAGYMRGQSGEVVSLAGHGREQAGC